MGYQNGRDTSSGRFVKGYAGGPGNPHAHLVSKLRRAAIDAIDPAKFAEIMRKLLSLAERCARDAEATDNPAARAALTGAAIAAAEFVANRTMGKPIAPVLVADERDPSTIRATPEEHGILLRLLERQRMQNDGATGNPS